MNSALILAGGKGVRFKAEKQFINFHGKTLFEHVRDTVSSIVDEVVIVGVDIEGGDTRTESIRNGLNHLSAESSRVVILEAARPLVTKEQILTLLNSQAHSCSFYTPLIETILIDGTVYPNRKRCVSFQTPQAFTTQMLKEAYNSGDYLDMTDETRVMYDYYKEKAELHLGGPNLTKVTYPHDLDLLDLIIKKYNIQL